MSEYPLESVLHLIEIEATKREKNAKLIRDMVRLGETHSDALASAGEDERAAEALRTWVSKLNQQNERIDSLQRAYDMQKTVSDVLKERNKELEAVLAKTTYLYNDALRLVHDRTDYKEMLLAGSDTHAGVPVDSTAEAVE